MNCIFEVYSNVYKAAMMHGGNRLTNAAYAKNSGESKTGFFARLFHRG
jgi:hypothetical protein